MRDDRGERASERARMIFAGPSKPCSGTMGRPREGDFAIKGKAKFLTMATGKKTQGDDERLGRLFKRYNRIYWRGHLPPYRVRAALLDSTVHRAHCDPRKRTIEIDPSQCASDRVVRSKLLHEMVHAAIPSNHDLKFCAELERLLRLGAPYIVEAWDCSNVKISHARFPTMGRFSLKELIPRRLPLIRRRMQRLDNRRISRVRPR